MPEEDTEEIIETDEAATEEISDETTVETVASDSKSIEVASGMDSRAIANILEAEGIIDDAAEYDAYLCANGYDRHMKAGHFDIPTGLSVEELSELLTL